MTIPIDASIIRIVPDARPWKPSIMFVAFAAEAIAKAVNATENIGAAKR